MIPWWWVLVAALAGAFLGAGLDAIYERRRQPPVVQRRCGWSEGGWIFRTNGCMCVACRRWRAEGRPDPYDPRKGSPEMADFLFPRPRP